jgi:FMN reductase
MVSDDQPSVVALVGHPRPGSRTARVAAELAQAIASRLRPPRTVDLIELGTLGASVFESDQVEVVDLRARLECAAVIVVMSPTYKASYTGILKVFLDGCDPGCWAGRIAIPAMVAASPGHGYAVDIHLRPLLEELGALCPATFFMTEAELSQLEHKVASWAGRIEPLLPAEPGAAHRSSDSTRE